MSDSLIYIIGTSRKDGNTWFLLNHVNKKTNAKIIDLSGLNISYFDYEHRNIQDDFIKTIEEIVQHDVIGFVSPMYWYSISARMKTFIDRLSDLLGPRKDLGRMLRGKKTFLMATGKTQKQLTNGMIDPIKLTSEYMGMQYMGSFYAITNQNFIIDSPVLEEADKFLRNILEVDSTS